LTERDTDAGRTDPAKTNGGAHRGAGVSASAGAWLKRTAPKVRLRLAKLIWLIALVAALVLGIGALLVALRANRDNVLVSAVVGGAETIDGPFEDVFTLRDHIQQVLVNWGLAAVAYLIVGGILARLVRP